MNCSPSDILSAISSLQRQVETSCKKQKPDVAISLTSNGNKEQYLHTVKITDHIELALHSLEQADIEGAKEHLSNATADIEAWQKLIRLADRSPEGWATVKEYVADDLADNSRG